MLMKKLLIRIILGIVVLIVLVVVAMGVFLDSAIKKGVETVGPQIAKVDVKVDGVNLSLFSGSAKVKGLTVSNPEGYKTPHAIKMGTANVAVKPGSLLSHKVVVKLIHLEAPDVILEGGLTGNNLRKILDNVNSSSGAPEAPPKQQTPEDKAAAKKLQVDDVLISGAKVSVYLNDVAGVGGTMPIPDIHLTNLGQGPEGITAGDLTKRILSELTDAAIKAGMKAATDIGKGAVQEATKDIGKSAEGLKNLNPFKKKE